jgi:electron transfer flavoprotein beta subunit
MGADGACLLSDRVFAGADTLATSYTLAGAIRRLGTPDLVICGEESSDGATAQVPPGIAEWLDIAQVTSVTEVALIDQGVRLWARRNLPGGHEGLTVPLPALCSVQAHATRPRFLDMDRRAWADTAPVAVWGAADLDLDPEAIGAAGSATVVAGTREAAQRERRREMLTGPPTEQARALVARLWPALTVPATSPPADVGRTEQQAPMSPGEALAPATSPATTAERLPRSARATS